jgi:hypothetical protein
MVKVYTMAHNGGLNDLAICSIDKLVDTINGRQTSELLARCRNNKKGIPIGLPFESHTSSCLHYRTDGIKGTHDFSTGTRHQF